METDHLKIGARWRWELGAGLGGDAGHVGQHVGGGDFWKGRVGGV